MGRKFFLLALLSLLSHSVALAQIEGRKETPSILMTLPDVQGERSEGYFLLPPRETMVSVKDDKENTGLSKYLKSITLGEFKEESLVADPRQEAKYSLRIENSHRIYTFGRKHTLSLNASLGLVTRTADPATIYTLFSGDSSQTPAMRQSEDQPLVADKSIFFKLQLSF